MPIWKEWLEFIVNLILLQLPPSALSARGDKEKSNSHLAAIGPFPNIVQYVLLGDEESERLVIYY